MQKLKIIQLAPLEEAIPPKKYGGVQRVIYDLTEGLVARGHTVHLFASGTSQTSARLIPIGEKELRLITHNDWRLDALALKGLGEALTRINEVPADIVHNHLSWKSMAFLPLIRYPVVTTLHGPLDWPFEKIPYEQFTEYPYVSISYSQRRPLPQLNYAANVYHGIDVQSFSFSGSRGEYFAFLGRTSPEKGIKEALLLAKQTGVQLRIAAKADFFHEDFFKKELVPLIDNDSRRFLGEINAEQKSDFLGNAIALLAPIQWEEPFGLYLAEAMACGTPVIAFGRGSVPELVKDGETGFICKPNDLDGMARAMGKMLTMPEAEYRQMRYACRKRAETYFTREIMVQAYETVYYQLLHRS